MSIKEQLRELILSEGMDYFGVSPVERLKNLPKGHRPCDLLPNAKSVISIGLKIPKGAIAAHNQAFKDESRHAIYSYTVHGYNKVNDKLDLAAFKVVKYLEKTYNKVAYPIPSGVPRDEALLMSAMSNRYAAVCAGHGEFGWSGFVLTPKHGAKVRWVTVISEQELEPDEMYKGEKLCLDEKCMLCVKICPTKALSALEAVDVEISDVKSKYAKRNKPMCRLATAGLVKGTPGKMQADIPETIDTMNQWRDISKKDNPWQRMEFSHANYCQRCMTLCPIGE